MGRQGCEEGTHCCASRLIPGTPARSVSGGSLGKLPPDFLKRMGLEAVEDNMKPVEFETTRVNLWHIGAIATALVVNAFGLAGVYFTLTNNDVQSGAQIAELKQTVTQLAVRTDTRIAAVENKIPQFEVIALQIQRLTEISAQNTKSIEATNDRLTAIVENQSDKLDNIVQRISELTTEVKVIQSQISDQQRAQRTRFPVLRK